MLALLVEPQTSGINDLFFLTSANGADLFTNPIELNAQVDVHPHREGQPRLLMGKSGTYYVLWTGSANDGKGMQLNFSRSENYGHSFSTAIALDGQNGGNHPFFNATTTPAGELVVAWISYEQVAGAVPGTGNVEVISSKDGGHTFSPAVRASINVCPCCRPELVIGQNDVWYLGWRTVRADQRRDVAIASSHDKGRAWSDPVLVSTDNWEINGCPDSGPSMAILQNRLFVTWYTVVDGTPRLFWTESHDEGKSFSSRQLFSGDIRSPNHPYLTAIGDRLIVAFQGRDPDEGAGWANQRIYLRELKPNLSKAPLPVPRGQGSATYPVISELGPGSMIVAWTDLTSEGPRAVGVRAYLR